MKKYLIVSIGLACGAPMYAADQIATKGALTEGLFIIQNKQREVQEYVQELKKALTQCLILSEAKHKKAKALLERYHCSLKEMLYPGSIKELEVLASQLSQIGELFLQEKPVTEVELSKAVNKAFLMKDKIDAEERMIELIFILDTQQDQLKTKERHNVRGSRPARRKHIAEITALKTKIDADKKKLRQMRDGLMKINNELYQFQTPAERMHIDKLECLA